MKNKKRIAIIAIVACIIVAASVAGITVYASSNSNTICKGIYINTVDVGGMTKEEALEALSQYMETAKDTNITVFVDENTVPATVADFGMEADLESTVDTALDFGKTGNFIKRYKEIKDLENESLIIPLQVKVNQEMTEQFVSEKCSVYDIPAENASMKRENGAFIITDETIGRMVEVDQTAAKIEETLCQDWSFEDTEIEAVMTEDDPEYTRESLSMCTDVLGTFSTTYATSSVSRANNLANGARLINGSIIWPGDTFSTGKTLQPITVENGYSIASAYENGQVVDSVGGGVCQVATTLYNAALKAEIEIAERSNHSMIVGYVKPSMDAAIAGDYKDLKLTNDTETPLYIEASTVGRTITFTIYGKETRDLEHRSVEFESKVLEVIQPGEDKVTEDDTQPVTYKKVTQSAHVGYKAELWKVVYENGVEVSRERVNYSSYAAEPAYITVGTKEEEKEKDEEKEEEEEDKDKEEESEKETSSPKPSKKPSASPSPSPSASPEEDNDEAQGEVSEE